MSSDSICLQFNSLKLLQKGDNEDRRDVGSVVHVDRGPMSDQTKDYKNGIYCFSAKNTALRIESNML
jgi:hypothetical protein